MIVVVCALLASQTSPLTTTTEEAPAPPEIDAPAAPPAQPAPASEPPTVAERYFVEGERVLLIADELGAPLPLRLRDELEALGLFVVLRDDDDVVDVVATARDLGSAAAIEVRGNRLDLWADLLDDDGQVARATLVSNGDDRDVVALRAAELVRARLMRGPRRTTPETSGAAPSTITSTDTGRDFDIDASVGLHGFSPPHEVWRALFPVRAAYDQFEIARRGGMRVDTDAHAAIDQARVGARLSIPTVPAFARARDGTADLWFTDLQLEAAWRIGLLERVDLSLGGAFGVTWLHARGRALTGGESHDADAIVGSGGPFARVTWRVAPPFGVFLDVRGSLMQPTPAINIGGVPVPFGPITLGATIGVALDLPREPNARDVGATRNEVTSTW